MKMKKLIAVSIIFFFIGVAVVPSVNFTVVKASNENDLVEVTTQACGINGFGNQIVKLTKEKCYELENLLNNIQVKFDAVKTGAEAVSIYNNAIVELNKYGLLPKGMNVLQAQRLVTGKYQTHIKSNNLFRKILDDNNIISKYTNVLCFVLANTNSINSKCLFIQIPFWLILPLYLSNYGSMILFIVFLLSFFSPIALLSLFAIEGTNMTFRSFGLNGYIKDYFSGGFDDRYIYGFSGLKISFGESEISPPFDIYRKYGFVLGFGLAMTEIFRP